jgi:peptidase E
VIGLLVGLSVLLLSSVPHRGDALGPSTTTTTTTTITTTTTTTLPTPSVASSAGAIVTALDAGVANGSVAPQVGQQLANQLQPLLYSPHPESTQEETQQFDQLVQTFDMDVANDQISGKTTVAALTRSIDGLAAALGTSVPTSTMPSKPGHPGGPGKGHGHGKGN